MYLGPILAAPLAHIAVSSYKVAKTRRARIAIVGIGVIGSTVLSLGMRGALMVHAGYAGGGASVEDRILHVSESEKAAVQQPSLWTIVKEAFKGFG